MKESKQTRSITIGKSKRISVLNGTQELWDYVPNQSADVILDITITERIPSKE